ncbi:MAG TPA: aminotransferase class I/II-fold pyridoxal phosphate-dependent enzyme [Acidobacteriaceae bacterium]|jgi:threonine-phosphate decarboxylase
MSEKIPAHGGQLRAIAAQFGVAERGLLDFSASIDPHPMPPAVVEELQRLLAEGELLSAYPEMTYANLRSALARYVGVDVAALAVANGVMALLHACVDVFALKRCAVFVPGFSEYERTLRIAGCEPVPAALKEQHGFLPERNNLRELLSRGDVDAVLLANPHSPSGALLQRAEMEQIVRWVSDAGKLLIVDEAFIDYSPFASAAAITRDSQHLIVLRSLTKFFAIPGARVAYAVAHPMCAAKLLRALPLWPVDALAAKLAELLLADDPEPRRVANEQERDWLAEQLRELGLLVFPSAANFLLFRTAAEMDLWSRMILEHSIVIRACGNFRGLDDHCFRVGVRGREDNLRLLAALGSCFAKELSSAHLTPPVHAR